MTCLNKWMIGACVATLSSVAIADGATPGSSEQMMLANLGPAPLPIHVPAPPAPVSVAVVPPVPVTVYPFGRAGEDIAARGERVDATRFADEARALVDGAPDPVRWLVIEAEAIVNLDYTAARVLLGLIDELAQRKIGIVFARVSASLRADMDRHGVTAAVGAGRIFYSRHEALLAVGCGNT